MKTHQKTIDRIKELVPRLMELRFGCEVHLGGFANYRIVGKDKDGKFIGVGKHIINDYQEIRFFSENKIKTITGFDPDLESVLKAIDPYGNYGLIAGHISKIDRKNRTYEFIATWHSGDTFSDQDEETKQAITDILIKTS